MLEVGHEYRVTLKSQVVWWTAKSTAELLGGSEYILVEELLGRLLIRLASKVEL